MNVLNSIGESTEPCGTPIWRFLVMEKVLLILTWITLFDIRFWIVRKSSLSIFMWIHFCNSLWCQTWSKALVMSKKVASIFFLLANWCFICDVNFTKCSVVDLPFLNPAWFSGIILFLLQKYVSLLSIISSTSLLHN